MHEARLCLSLIRLAEEVLAREGGQNILRLELEVGELSGVAPEALEAAFPIGLGFARCSPRLSRGRGTNRSRRMVGERIGTATARNRVRAKESPP